MEGKFIFIRGARLLKSLMETTYNQLRSATDQFIPTTKKRQHATGPVHVVKMEYIPYVNTTDLMVKSEVNSAGSGKRYHPQILFLSATFEETDEPDNVTFTDYSGKERHMEPVDLNRSNCKVRCDCLDFYYRFAAVNFNTDALYGNPPPPYRKKTTRPDANPMKTPGVCKHVIKTIEELKNAGMVK